LVIAADPISIHRSTAKPLNVHIMMVEPERYLGAFAKAGADHLLRSSRQAAGRFVSWAT
jgi:ribulose-phosphate 3-epimerase